MFERHRTLSVRPSLLMFRIDRAIAQISSSVVLYRVPRSGSFTLAKRSKSNGLRRKRLHLVVQKPIILNDSARSHTAAAVTDLLRRWQWEFLEHPPYSPDKSSCDCDFFVKVKEPLRGTRYKRYCYMCYWAVNTENQQRWTRWWCTTPSKHLAKGDK